MEWFSWIEIIFIFCTLILLGYYLGFWRRLLIFKASDTSFSDFPFVSVVICARDEADNLLQFIPEFLSQDYPAYEVIVVDDSSSDDSSNILKDFSNKYKHLRVFTFETKRYSQGKKEVLEYGISQAKSDYLVLTDADCRPNSCRWLKTMVNGFSDGSELVLGVGQYEKKESKINQLIQLDTGFIALNYLSFALAKYPYMSVGRNVAYRKKLFYKIGGFTSHYDTPGGDDDLFVNELSKNTKFTIVISSEGQTKSIPKENFKSFFLQKIRHVSSGINYNKRNKIILSIFYSFSVFWYLLVPIVLINQKQLLVLSTLVVLKKTTMYSLIRRIFIKIGVDVRPSMILLTEFYSVFIHGFAIVVTIFKSKKGKW